MNTRTSRRSALKLLGLGGIGSIVVPATLFQACQDAAATPGLALSTLSSSQAATLKAIQDAIIPQTTNAAGTTIPSASDVGSVEFFDTYLTHGYEPKDRDRVLYQLDKFAELMKSDEGVEIADASEANITAQMERYFATYEAPAAKDNTMEIEGNKVERQGGDDEADDVAEPTSENLGTHTQVEEAVVFEDDPTEVNNLLQALRGITLESYFQSEYVGENVLNYEEVPGKYVGIYPMSEVPNGYAWSL